MFLASIANSDSWYLLITVAAVVFSSVTAPLLLSSHQDKLRRQEKDEDYRRQDAVAAKAAEVATQAAAAAVLLQAAQEATTARTEEVARLAALAATETERRLSDLSAQTDQIHTLVNSSLSTALRNELNAMDAMLVTMKEINVIKVKDGLPEDPATLGIIEATENRRDQLRTELEHRDAQTALAEAELQSAKLAAEDVAKKAAVA
jgi:hypothetical protein